MRNFTELFEYLKNTSQTDLYKELKIIVNTDFEEIISGISTLNAALTYLNQFLMLPKPIIIKKEDEILTTAEVASILKLNEKTVRRLIHQRKIEAYDIGTVDKKDARGNLRVLRSACEKFLQSCKL
jgi:excisionase family DNA binding protein